MSHQVAAAAQAPCGHWWRNRGRARGAKVDSSSRSRILHWPRTLAAKRQAPLAYRHLRFRPQQQRAGVLHCFLLDCSGSMLGGERLALAKGLLLRLLERAYELRATVALIRFAGLRAEVLMAPTRARRWNDDWVTPIGGGGGTPLGAALDRAEHLLRRTALQRPQQQRILWLMTDGRTNESPSPPPAAQVINVIDCERQRIRLGRCRQLAERWEADFTTIDELIGNPTPNEEPGP